MEEEVFNIFFRHGGQAHAFEVRPEPKFEAGYRIHTKEELLCILTAEPDHSFMLRWVADKTMDPAFVEAIGDAINRYYL